MYRVEKFRSEKNKEHYFRIVAQNGNIICSSEGYKNKVDRDDIADNIAINLIRNVADQESFEKAMNNINWFKFPMYRIYTNSPSTGEETFFLNERTGATGLYNAVEKDSLIGKVKNYTKVEEVSHDDFLKEDGE